MCSSGDSLNNETEWLLERATFMQKSMDDNNYNYWITNCTGHAYCNKAWWYRAEVEGWTPMERVISYIHITSYPSPPLSLSFPRINPSQHILSIYLYIYIYIYYNNSHREMHISCFMPSNIIMYVYVYSCE